MPSPAQSASSPPAPSAAAQAIASTPARGASKAAASSPGTPPAGGATFQTCIATALAPADAAKDGTVSPPPDPATAGAVATMAGANELPPPIPPDATITKAAAKGAIPAQATQPAATGTKRQAGQSQDQTAPTADLAASPQATPVPTATAMPSAFGVPAPPPPSADPKNGTPTPDQAKAGTGLQPAQQASGQRASAQASAPLADAADAGGAKPDPASPLLAAPFPAPSPLPSPALGGTVAAEALMAPATASASATLSTQHGDGAPPAATPTTPSQPAAQIMPALVSLGTAAGGGSRLTVRLDPAELGQVQIQIDRAHDATAAVRITVERPETLSLLMRDQHDLQRTLDQAGVPADGRTLSFQLADQPPPSNGSSNGGASQSFTGGSGNDPGQPQGGRNMPWQGRSEAGSMVAARWTRAWARGGLDITA